MANKNNNLFRQTGLRRASWLALLSVAVLQVSLALHQFEHNDKNVGDTCELCVQLDRMGDAVADESSSSQLPVVYAALDWRTPVQLAGLVQTRNFDSRAPPQL